MNLNYWKQNLGRVPDEVWSHVDAETLILADNGLTALPAEIGALQNLRVLDLGHNALASIPTRSAVLWRWISCTCTTTN